MLLSEKDWNFSRFRELCILFMASNGSLSDSYDIIWFFIDFLWTRYYYYYFRIIIQLIRSSFPSINIHAYVSLIISGISWVWLALFSRVGVFVYVELFHIHLDPPSFFFFFNFHISSNNSYLRCTDKTHQHAINPERYIRYVCSTCMFGTDKDSRKKCTCYKDSESYTIYFWNWSFCSLPLTLWVQVVTYQQ